MTRERGARPGSRSVDDGWTAGGHRADSFAVLGLEPRADLTDDDVRAAWRRIAAGTHPDLADGGDPARFAAAAAAYTELRSQFGRGEARAALAEQSGALGHGRPAGVRRPTAARDRLGAGPRAVINMITRLSRARANRLACRIVIAVGGAAIAWIAAGPGPAGPAVAVGAATWLIVTAGRDLSRSG